MRTYWLETNLATSGGPNRDSPQKDGWEKIGDGTADMKRPAAGTQHTPDE